MSFRFVVVLLSLAAAGCAVQRTTPSEAPVPPAVATSTGTEDATPIPREETVAAAPGATLTPESLHPAAPPPSPSAPPPERHSASSPPAHAATSLARPAPEGPATAEPRPATLDFAALGARLRATKAIGLLAKLAVKSEADDLLAQFRDYYQQRGNATLPDLHRSYDTLVVKLLGLLQDGDPPLATDIDQSRAALWDVLSDQRKFIASNLMAGAVP